MSYNAVAERGQPTVLAWREGSPLLKTGSVPARPPCPVGKRPLWQTKDNLLRRTSSASSENKDVRRTDSQEQRASIVDIDICQMRSGINIIRHLIVASRMANTNRSKRVLVGMWSVASGKTCINVSRRRRVWLSSA
ncbi:MAG: hypothetical protein MI923_30055 [Phycisphaerales bacterium]|nr:hypothetical protein [Phycisphaerales bacterium]